MRKYEPVKSRAITGSFYFTQNCAGAIAGERNPYERKSYQSNFYSNLRTDQLHSWSIDSTVLLMVACNVLDYATGLMASTYRSEDINSYKSIRGIMKKVSMWLLVIVGAIIDQLLLYASQTAGISLPFTFLVACIVAIWIICNEIISILENIKDMGVTIPAFLIPLVTHVKSQVEDKVSIDDTEKEDSEGE